MRDTARDFRRLPSESFCGDPGIGDPPELDFRPSDQAG
jgi:hypothetical protein